MYDRFKIIVDKDSSKDMIQMFLDSFERHTPSNPPSVIQR